MKNWRKLYRHVRAFNVKNGTGFYRQTITVLHVLLICCFIIYIFLLLEVTFKKVPILSCTSTLDAMPQNIIHKH
jgi:hypothetical protein